jgi:hypothetical protein
MLKNWTKLLPYFVVVWLARKGEKFTINTMSSRWSQEGVTEIFRPYKGVYIEAKQR